MHVRQKEAERPRSVLAPDRGRSSFNSTLGLVAESAPFLTCNTASSLLDRVVIVGDLCLTGDTMGEFKFSGGIRDVRGLIPKVGDARI